MDNIPSFRLPGCSWNSVSDALVPGTCKLWAIYGYSGYNYTFKTGYWWWCRCYLGYLHFNLQIWLWFRNLVECGIKWRCLLFSKFMHRMSLTTATKWLFPGKNFWLLFAMEDLIQWRVSGSANLSAAFSTTNINGTSVDFIDGSVGTNFVLRLGFWWWTNFYLFQPYKCLYLSGNLPNVSLVITDGCDQLQQFKSYQSITTEALFL